MRMGRPNVMRYKQLKNAQKKAQKEVTADGRGIDFLNEWYVRKDMSRAVHLIFPDVEDAYEPVPLHKTKDNIEFPCTEREDCVGCEDNLELKEKRGLTVIACEWYHDIESQGYGGKMVTKSEQCPGERACDHCRAGIPRYFGKKQVAILPPTQFVSALDADLDTQRKCAACKNDLIPTMLTCPQCGDTLLEVGNGVTFDMIEESFNGQVSCPTHGFVNPDTFDICRDATKQEVECELLGSKPRPEIWTPPSERVRAGLGPGHAAAFPEDASQAVEQVR